MAGDELRREYDLSKLSGGAAASTLVDTKVAQTSFIWNPTWPPFLGAKAPLIKR